MKQATKALQSTEAELMEAQRAAQQAVDARRKAEREAVRLAGLASTYWAQEITPREAALRSASTAESEARAKLEAARAGCQELARTAELEKKAWAAAEGDAQEHKKQTAKQLSQIYADLVTPRAPDKIRNAVIGPKTLAPQINNRSLKQLARSAGLVTIAHVAYHLMVLEAARSVPLVVLLRHQWLDSPLDGLGGGPEGDRLAHAVLSVCAKTAGSDAQIVLTTPQTLPADPHTEHGNTRPLIPHARLESDVA